MDDDAVTLRELVDQTATVIGSRVEARWLVEVASGLDADELDVAMSNGATVRVVAHLDAMVARYRSGEPLQYVLGRWSFRHLDLAVDHRVLIPRPETELVAGLAIQLTSCVDGERRVADLGTGSGAIGLSLAAELPIRGTEVWITDVSADALAVARSNLAGIGRAAANVRLAEGPWFGALPTGLAFDVIVSNPPYVAAGSPLLDAAVRDWEPELALVSGADGLDAIRTLVDGAPAHLGVDGWLVLEIGSDQGDVVRSLLTDAGYREVDVRPDLAGHDRIAVGRRPLA